MARQEHTPLQMEGPYPVGQAPQGTLDISLLACDVANKEQAKFREGMMLIVQNAHAVTPHNITVTSIPTSGTKRSGDRVYAVTANNKPCALGPFAADGWRQADGNLYFESADPLVSVAVLWP